MYRVGIDIQGDQAVIARVTSDMGRPVIDRLEEIAVDQIAGQDWLKACYPVLSVNDSQVQIKSLNLRSVPDSGYRVAGKLELLTCVLEPESEFLFSTYPTGLDNSFLAMICRKKELKRLVDLVGLAPKDGFQSDSFIPRSAALGSGFVTYCQSEPGELIGLIDLGRESAAISLIYKGKPISLAHMPLSALPAEKETRLKQISVQARTMINFQISRLSGAGLNVPLATLILSGEQADQSTCDIFLAQFSSGVKLPQINPAFLDDTLRGRSDVSRYLVAMGLAFNSLAR